MHIVNIREAKTQLSRLLEELAGGQNVIAPRAAQPVARQRAYSLPRRRFPVSSVACSIRIAHH
jgi:antitoxin (DNA-binding transcriptional repressor) of toxin-antitoxin stability system